LPGESGEAKAAANERWLLRISEANMYCPSCGAESAQGLRYCKQCGANLNLTGEMLPGKFPMALTVIFLLIIGIISITGIIGSFAMASDMSMRGTPPGNFLPVMILGPLVALGIDALLIWLLLRLVKIYHQPGAMSQPQPSRHLKPVDFMPPQLNAPPSAIGSVTEHTTRNFDEYEKTLRARPPGRDTNEV
jgi:hypothetical protein